MHIPGEDRRAYAWRKPATPQVPEPIRGVEPRTQPYLHHAEFRSVLNYRLWLQQYGARIRIVAMSTTKRWGFLFGFLGDVKTYSVTYESTEAGAFPEKEGWDWGATLFALFVGYVVYRLVVHFQPDWF